MDFLRIAGNEIILDNWISYLTDCRIIIQEKADKVYYAKTVAGQKVHDVLKIHDQLGPLFYDLSRKRRRKAEEFRWSDSGPN